jgi:PhzF family phenazine biosynthesis protein
MLKIFQVDAFTRKVFGGNPAAVVPLENWIDDAVLQSIANENNLAETAFTVPAQDGWELRWFTPVAEVALCGHATLATAHVLITHLGCDAQTLNFYTRQSGKLTVEKQPDGKLAMSFPAIELTNSDDGEEVSLALGSKPSAVLSGNYSATEYDLVAVFDSLDQVAALTPDFAKFKTLNSRGIIATAPGTSCDFVSRYFAPNFGVNEDPVTGSAHCLLTPYWSNVLGKQHMNARQISPREGELDCTLETADRVIISGYAVDYLTGVINY